MDSLNFGNAVYQQTGNERDQRITSLSYVFIAAVAVLNIFATKITAIQWNGETVRLFGLDNWPFEFTVGTMLYAITFPCTDVISELIGQRRAARLVWHGFAVSAGVALMSILAISMPSASWWVHQEAYSTVLGTVWRLILAGMCSYLIAQRFDVWLFDVLIRFAASRNSFSVFADRFWKRALGSTLTSQLLDSVIFIHIAFFPSSGIAFTFEDWSSKLVPLVMTTWLIKAILTLALLPAIAALREWVGYSNELELPDENFVAQQFSHN